MFVLGISSTDCLECCESEPLLLKLQEKFKANVFTFYGKHIPIARIDFAKNVTFL